MTTTADRLTVNVGPITTKYEVRGSGHPLLYLHGAFGYAEWPEFLNGLTDRFTVYAPTHPGFEGDSDIDHIQDLLELTLYHADLVDALGVGFAACRRTLFRSYGSRRDGRDQGR